MQTPNLFQIFLISSLIFFVVACGGGSGSSSTADNTTTANTDVATTGANTSSEYSFTSAEMTTVVNTHNAIRSQVNQGTFDSRLPIPSTQIGNVRWDDSVAQIALNYAPTLRANNCPLSHNPDLSALGAGENIFWSSQSNIEDVSVAVTLWAAEVKDYTYNPIDQDCASGAVCGHFTQVIWSSSDRIGCAKVSCGDQGTIVLCNYKEPGNFIGQYPYPSN